MSRITVASLVGASLCLIPAEFHAQQDPALRNAKIACGSKLNNAQAHAECVNLQMCLSTGKKYTECSRRGATSNSRNPSRAADNASGAGSNASAGAADTSYLSEMPSVERVVKEIRGKDQLDTAARQAGAFWQLEGMIDVLSGGRVFRRQLTPSEEQQLSLYKRANSNVHSEVRKFFPVGSPTVGRDSPSVKWSNLASHYRSDRDFQKQLLDKFFTPAWRDRFQQAQSGLHQRIATRRAEEAQAAERSQSGTREPSNVEKLVGMLTDVAEFNTSVAKREYDRVCASRERPRGKGGATIRGTYSNVTGDWLKYFHSHKKGAQIDFECGIGIYCGEIVLFSEYEMRGDQVRMDRMVLTRTGDGSLSGPKAITVTVEQPATYAMNPVWERGTIGRETSSTPRSGEGWKQSFEKVQTSPARMVQESCAIGMLRKTIP